MASGPITIANNMREARRQGMSRNIREGRKYAIQNGY